jgi:hypothetical protein
MNRIKTLIGAGLVLGFVGFAASSGVAAIGRVDYLTMSRPTALPGVVLPAGKYAFEVVEGHADLVRVTDRATNRVLYLGFTDVIRRPARATDPLRLGEAPAGRPVPIAAWFPIGSSRGHAFKHR